MMGISGVVLSCSGKLEKLINTSSCRLSKIISVTGTLGTCIFTIYLESVHRLCNAERGGGSGQALLLHLALILKVNQNFDRKCYMEGGRSKIAVFLIIYNLWMAAYNDNARF